MKHSKKISTHVKQSLNAQIERRKAEFLILIDADFYYQQDSTYPSIKLSPKN